MYSSSRGSIEAASAINAGEDFAGGKKLMTRTTTRAPLSSQPGTGPLPPYGIDDLSS